MTIANKPEFCSDFLVEEAKDKTFASQEEAMDHLFKALSVANNKWAHEETPLVHTA